MTTLPADNVQQIHRSTLRQIRIQKAGHYRRGHPARTNPMHPPKWSYSRIPLCQDYSLRWIYLIDMQVGAFHGALDDLIGSCVSRLFRFADDGLHSRFKVVRRRFHKLLNTLLYFVQGPRCQSSHGRFSRCVCTRNDLICLCSNLSFRCSVGLLFDRELILGKVASDEFDNRFVFVGPLLSDSLAGCVRGFCHFAGMGIYSMRWDSQRKEAIPEVYLAVR